MSPQTEELSRSVLGRGIGGTTVTDKDGNKYVLWANRIWTRSDERLEWDKDDEVWKAVKK